MKNTKNFSSIRIHSKLDIFFSIYFKTKSTHERKRLLFGNSIIRLVPYKIWDFWIFVNYDEALNVTQFRPNTFNENLYGTLVFYEMLNTAILQLGV